MTQNAQNPAGGPGFAEKVVVSGDEANLPSPAENGNNNSASAQCSRLLPALIKKPLSTLEARQRLDVLHPAARVQELRKRGHLIDTVWTDDFTSEGKLHRVALYIYRGKKGAE